MTNRSLVLRARPVGIPEVSDFEIVEGAIPIPASGEFVVRNLYISLDPGIRQRLSLSDSYVRLIELGAPLTATTVGVVTASADPRARVGDHVTGFHTVADYSLTTWGPLSRTIDPNLASLHHHLSVLGPTGLTAYFGLLHVCRPERGETVLVSAAAGAVGSIVAQIARIKGCRSVGIAGGATKTGRLLKEFHIDAAIDYQGRDLVALVSAIRAAAPEGVDAYFDNVGGVQLDAALDCLNPGGRVALCGLISQYNAVTPPPPLTNLFKLIARSARMEGFVVLSYADRFPEALGELATWIRTGDIVFREQIEIGLDQAAPAFISLFRGANQGKLMIQTMAA